MIYKLIKKGWAFIFYCFFKVELKTRYLYKYLNPFIWNELLTHSYKNREAKHKAREGFKNSFLNDKVLSSTWAEIYLSGYLAVLVCIVFNVTGGRKIWGYILHAKIYQLIFIVALTFVCYQINNHTLFLKNNYLKFFEEFDEWNISKKRVYGLVSLLIFILSILFFIYSFQFRGLISNVFLS